MAIRELFRLCFLSESSIQFLRYSLLCEPPLIALMTEGCAYQFVERMARPRRIALMGFIFVSCSVIWAILGIYYPSALLTLSGDVVPVLAIGNIERAGAFLILILSVGLLWRLENILRESEGGLRWRVKYAVLGIFIIGGEFIWEMGYRLAYLKIVPVQFGINSLVLVSGVGFFVFAVVRHRLFEVEVYVSRYVVYRSVVFLGVGLYLVILGLITTVIRYTGLTYSDLAWQAFLYLSLLALVVVGLSQDVRNKIRFFINTHFFTNKYDYRKEWVEYSERLVEVQDEKEILSQLEKMIYETMFINWVTIWLKDKNNVFKQVVPQDESNGSKSIDLEHPFIKLLRESVYLIRSQKYGYLNDLGILKLPDSITSFIDENNIALAVPLLAKGEFLGFIGVGPELTKLDYGQDDIDLLKGLASQTATALDMVRLHEELMQNQKLHLFNQLSIFVMHDLKNAASLLSLILQNAPTHIHDPDFQEDLLSTISSASRRLEKVMMKLRALKPPEERELRKVDIAKVVGQEVDNFRRLCSGIEIKWEPPSEVYCMANEELLKNVIENLLMNAKDALDGRGEISVTVDKVDDQVVIRVSDNGPGIPVDFLEQKLFRPFQTTKKDGLGIGLWQVKNFVEAMKGRITVKTSPGMGTTFEIILSCE
ncbi:MAG: PEP-CTERM system histidine kinase PrsK [Deltaproteobacteria bacterium]|nr:MAG: PEP-CTERM system histidine kinase PrsK [Deltaproteobacteria bacterium]